MYLRTSSCEYIVYADGFALLDACSSIKREFTVPSKITGPDGVEYQIIGMKPSAFDKSLVRKIIFDEESLIKTVSMKYFQYSMVEHVEISKSMEKVFLSEKRIHISVSLHNRNILITSDGSLVYRACEEIIELPANRKSLMIRESIKILGKYCCYNSITVEKVVFPSSLTEIEKYAFANCSNLLKVFFKSDSKLKIIRKSAFSCTKIRKMKFPSSLQVIGESSFFCCKNLEIISFNDDSELKVIETSAFRMTRLKEIKFPNILRIIDNLAFSDNDSLISISFTENSELKLIGTAAFCLTSLAEITFPSSLEEIQTFAFRNCKKLKKIFLANDSKLNIIAANSFDGCDNLRDKIYPQKFNNILKKIFK